MDKKYTATLKSAETEDWLDYHVVRPFSYLWALLFARLGVHPNTVTILSMVIGAGSCVFFAHGCYHYEGGEGLLYNLIAFFLLVWAAFWTEWPVLYGFCPSTWPLWCVSTTTTP